MCGLVKFQFTEPFQTIFPAVRILLICWQCLKDKIIYYTLFEQSCSNITYSRYTNATKCMNNLKIQHRKKSHWKNKLQWRPGSCRLWSITFVVPGQRQNKQTSQRRWRKQASPRCIYQLYSMRHHSRHFRYPRKFSYCVTVIFSCT